MALYLGKNLINGVLTSHFTTVINTTDATAKDLEIFKGKTAYVNGQKVTGTFEPDPEQIKAGDVIANVTGTFTNDGTATSGEHIRSGYIAYSKGVKITGTYNGLDTSDATATSGDHIRAGYTAYGPAGTKITGTYSGNDTSDATATAAMIQKGYTAYVKGNKITGTLAPAANTIKSGTTIAGVAGTLLATATNATAANIMSGKTAYNDSGTLITGTAFATTTNATAATIRSGYKAYSNTGTLITGTGYATTTTATSADILSGKTAYTNTGTLLTGTATAGTPIQIGTITGSRSISITTSFKPKGFMMYMDNSLYFDDAKNLYTMYADNTTSVSTRYSTGEEYEVSGGWDDPYISLAIPSFSYWIDSYWYMDDFRLSRIFNEDNGWDFEMSDTDHSSYTLYDWAIEGADSGSTTATEPDSGTGTATATYNATSLGITISDSYWIGRTWNYIIWG